MTEQIEQAAGACGIDDPNHDHDGIWWSAADELGRMCRPDERRPLPEPLRPAQRTSPSGMPD